MGSRAKPPEAETFLANLPAFQYLEMQKITDICVALQK